MNLKPRRYELVCVLVTLLFLVTACANQASKRTFDHQDCLDHVPRKVKGLKILEGPRTEASIINNMVPILCRGQILFNRMKQKDPSLEAGTMTFRVVVEYTGEVIAVDIEETTIQSDAFVKKISDMIMNEDFVNWTPNDIDAVFVYPAKFGP